MRILSKELTCPLCRSDWGPFLWRPPPPKRIRAPADGRREERRDTVHYGTHCGACRKVGPIRGQEIWCEKEAHPPWHTPPGTPSAAYHRSFCVYPENTVCRIHPIHPSP